MYLGALRYLAMFVPEKHDLLPLGKLVNHLRKVSIGDNFTALGTFI